MKNASIKACAVAVFLFVFLFSAASYSETDTSKVNINTAGVETLVSLKHVGAKYAERIVAYREKNKFEKPEDIMKVKGIGQKIFAANKDRIIVMGKDVAGSD